MKVVFLGTPDFSVGVLNAIYNSSHEILAVVTQPDRKVGRKGILTPSKVKVQAQNLGLKVLTYEKISKEGVTDLKNLNPDIMVTCAYGQILSQEILDIAKHGVINVHASLLPKYRGSSPIQWALINGEKQTGITIMQTALGIDSGDIIMQEKLDILENEYVESLFNRLSKLGASLIVKALDDIENNKVTYTPQNNELATHVKMIEKKDAFIDFNDTATNIVNKIRGLSSWPTCYTIYQGKMLKIYKAIEVLGDFKAGEVAVSDSKSGLIIGTSKNAIQVEELQLEGSKKMQTKEFLLGRNILVGTILGE